MLKPVRTVAPAALLTVAEVKAQARIDGSGEDAFLATLIDAVTATLDGPDGILGLALVTQTWTQSLGGFADVLRLPLAPVQSAAVSYLDADNDAQALAAAYRLHTDAQGAYLRRIEGAQFPAVAARDDAVTITMVCGYGAPAAVPSDIKQAALLMVAHLYEHREAVGPMLFHEIPMGARWLLERHRRIGV